MKKFYLNYLLKFLLTSKIKKMKNTINQVKSVLLLSSMLLAFDMLIPSFQQKQKEQTIETEKPEYFLL